MNTLCVLTFYYPIYLLFCFVLNFLPKSIATYVSLFYFYHHDVVIDIVKRFELDDFIRCVLPFVTLKLYNFSNSDFF